MSDASREVQYRARTWLERLRIESFLVRVDWHLEGALPGAERRVAVDSLRAELLSDHRKLSSALRDLGSPRALAAQYADDDTLRPLWSIGIITAGTALLIYWALFLSFVGGMLAAVESTASARAQAYFLFVQVEAFWTPDSVGIGWTSQWAWLGVPAFIVTIAFLIGARVWRALRPDRVTVA
ncbi:hypothetical protein KZC51_13115 [Microbacterium sp. SSW1-49]|uniref:DUF1700 domain-containing protein n=1 Tax=Microbacterium croceum TaxID=2851645 RepID=A0ABT0FG83_9MICO|nr:hypothetical protein [Microbacterium croceum]MCK2037071.1 hypothetical protein [Microbacterium croceum]